MARCRFSSLHADLPQLQGLLDEMAEVLLLGHPLEQLGDLRPPVLAGLGGVQQVHGEGVRLPAHRPEQVLPVCGCSVRMSSSFAQLMAATGRAGLAAARMGPRIRQVGVAQLAQLIAGLTDRAGGADDRRRPIGVPATTTSQSAASMVARSSSIWRSSPWPAGPVRCSGRRGRSRRSSRPRTAGGRRSWPPRRRRRRPCPLHRACRRGSGSGRPPRPGPGRPPGTAPARRVGRLARMTVALGLVAATLAATAATRPVRRCPPC